MNRLLYLLSFVFLTSCLEAPKPFPLYHQTIGDKNNPALVFVHGGLGYSSWYFENTVAREVANNGYHVIVYDQRGQGRSSHASAEEFNYRTYADDLKNLIESLNLKKPVLLSHSHGSHIAIKFEEYYPGLAEKIILINGHLEHWNSMINTVNGCRERFSRKEDTEGLKRIEALSKTLSMKSKDPRLIENVYKLIQEIRNCELMKLENPSSEAKELYSKILFEDPFRGREFEKFVSDNFMKTEVFIKQNSLPFVAKNKGRFFGIYGIQDGFFNKDDLISIEKAMNSPGKIRYFPIEAAHFPFLGNKTDFIEALNKIMSF